MYHKRAQFFSLFERLWAKLTTVTQRLRDEWETWWVNQGLNTKPLNQGPQYLTSWPCPNWTYTAGAVIHYHSIAIRSWIHQSPDLSPKHLCYPQPSLQEKNLTIWKLSHLPKSAAESPTPLTRSAPILIVSILSPKKEALIPNVPESNPLGTMRIWNKTIY